MTITNIIDGDIVRRSFAARDAASLLSLYAPDATVEIVDALNPPKNPRVLAGREAIAAHFADVFARDMTHEVDVVVASPDALGYVLRCTYADGMKVVCAVTAEVRDGLIVREVGVQAWDA